MPKRGLRGGKRGSVPGRDRTGSATSEGGSASELASFVPLEAFDGEGAPKLPLSSVVKLFVVSTEPNFLLPWQVDRQEQCTGSGFIIKGKLILTNAHVVSNYTSVRIRKNGGSDKFPAEVLYINPTCDLAVVTVKDELFWKDIPPLEIAPALPPLFSRCMVLGFPMGGDDICVTAGVVSRITTLPYEDDPFGLGVPELIAVQIDAAINPGNSGGPVFNEKGDVVGVAFSGLSGGDAQNIGYIIPKPVIDNFLYDFKHGKSGSICGFGFAVSPCENEALRRKFELVHPNSGVIVTGVAPRGAADKAGIIVDDIVTEIDGHKIGNDGTVEFRKNERLSLSYLISNHRIGDNSKVTVLRQGKLTNLIVKGEPPIEAIPRHHPRATTPSYYVFGGCVFCPLSVGLLTVAIEAISEEAWTAAKKPKPALDDEVIVIIDILANPINDGYELDELPHVTAVNGIQIKNLRHLKFEVEKLTEGFVSFKTASGASIVLDVKQCREAEKEILSTHAIPSPCSPNLLEPYKPTEPVPASATAAAPATATVSHAPTPSTASASATAEAAASPKQ